MFDSLHLYADYISIYSTCSIVIETYSLINIYIISVVYAKRRNIIYYSYIVIEPYYEKNYVNCEIKVSRTDPAQSTLSGSTFHNVGA